ncbi:MAG: hypothetical protein J7530_09690 [Novosphingobium sp.]|nr:hypothetical protein [Novosphingobium sp.]
MASKAQDNVSKPQTSNEKIQELDPPEISQIPFSIVDKTSNKTTKLLANSGNNKSIEGQNRWHRYDFKEPIFIYRIVVLHTNYPDYKEFEIRALTESGETYTSSSKPASGRVFLAVNEFCKSVEFKPPKAYFSGVKRIDSVEIYGFRKSQSGKFIQFARDIDDYKIKALEEIAAKENKANETILMADAAESRRTEANKEVNNLKTSADRQKLNLKRLESSRDELNTKLEVLNQSFSVNSRELSNIKSELDRLSSSRENLITDVKNKTAELKALKDNLDLFPSELSDFVRQGARNTRTLFWLAAAPIAIIVLMFLLLISGAVDLSTKITADQKINLEALIISRMPYVTVAITIITACYKLARSFIVELININRQRLNLTKISIIAKDVSNSSQYDLDLNHEEIYNFRVRLKMDLLKDHLKNYISPDFEPLVPNDMAPKFAPLGLLAQKALARSADEAVPQKT